MRKEKARKLFRKLFSGINEQQLRLIVRRANDAYTDSFWDFSEEPFFCKFHHKVYEFLKTGVTDDEKKYSRLYQMMDEGDFESHDRAYLQWFTRRVQGGKGRYKAYAPILDALEGMSVMLDEDNKDVPKT